MMALTITISSRILSIVLFEIQSPFSSCGKGLHKLIFINCNFTPKKQGLKKINWAELCI